MFVGPGLGVTQHCGVGALVRAYAPACLRTHTCVQEAAAGRVIGEK